MRKRALVVSVLMLAVPLATVAASGAQLDDEPVRIHVDETFHGEDTYQFSIRVDADERNHFNIAADSQVHAKGYYVDSGGNQSATGSQHATGIRGVVEYFSGDSCINQNGDDGCFIEKAGVPRQDLSEVGVHESSTGFTFENDPNWWAWGSAEGSIVWDNAMRYDVPDDADHLTIRIFLSIPDVDRLDVNVEIRSPHEIQMHGSTAHDGGFAHAGEDFDPDQHVDTWGAKVLRQGTQTVTQDAGDRVYAMFGPSWWGTSQTASGGASHNTAAVSDVSLHHADGTTEGPVLLPGAFGSGDLSLVGDDEPGDYTFEVHTHAGAGPQDIYAIGWTGETA